MSDTENPSGSANIIPPLTAAQVASIVNSVVGSVKVYVDKQLEKQKLESDKALTSTSEKVEKLIKVRL